MTSKISKMTKLSLKLVSQKIDKVLASDFSACLTNSGELYLWGPTPLG